MKRWCQERAARKRDWVLRIAPLRQADLPHEKVRLRVGLTVEEYRRAKRWLNEAVGLCAASAHPLTLRDAVTRIAERQVTAAIRVGFLRERGSTREQIRDRLGLSGDEYDIADEWWRDGLRAVIDPDPDE